MKKFLLIVLALAVAFSFTAPAMAKNGLSVGFGLGLKPNLGNLGDTIADDGLEGANAHPIWGKMIPDEKTLLVLDDMNVLKDVKTSGAMSGIDFAINVRYDIMNVFFARTGFNYTTKVMGGKSEWTYGPNSGGLATAGDGFLEWKYNSWTIPFVLGINIPVLDGKANFYAGIGFSYSKGGWSVEMEDTLAAYGLGLPAQHAKEKVEFEVSVFAPMYLIGADAEVANNLSIFIEWETVLAMAYSDVEMLKTSYAQSALGNDRLAYPIVIGGSIIRIGAKYSLGFATL